jgi:hypothetical protein
MLSAAALARSRNACPRLATDAVQGNAVACGLHKYRMKLETEPDRESGQVLEDADYVRDLEAPHLVKAGRICNTFQSLTVTRAALALGFSAIAHSARSRGSRCGSSRHCRSLIASISSRFPPPARRNSA